MNQKTLISLGALIVIAALAFMTMRAPEKGVRVGPKERPIAAFKAADVKELEVTSNGGKDHVTVKLDGGAWKVTAPGTYPADQTLCKTSIDQLEKLTFGDLVTEKKEKFADLEVSDDKGAHVVARGDAGKVLFDGWIGKAVSGFTMLRPTGKDQVWQSTGVFKYAFAKDAKQWRDHTILSLAQADVTRLSVEAAGQKLVLERMPPPEKKAEDKDAPAAPPPAPEAKWKLVESTVKVDPLDDAVPNSLLSSLAGLSAADFDDSGNYADAGLTAPRFKIGVVTKGVPATLLVGNVKGDDVWVQLEGKSQIFLLRKYAIERIAIRPADFRDKTLVKAKEDDIVSLDISVGGQAYTLEHEGSLWKYAKAQAAPLDDAKARALGTAFDDLKGGTFAETTDAATTGIAKGTGATGTATLHLRDRSTVKILVGSANKEGTDYYAQREGSPDVVLVKKYVADRFLKKPADLAKTAAPPAK